MGHFKAYMCVENMDLIERHMHCRIPGLISENSVTGVSQMRNYGTRMNA